MARLRELLAAATPGPWWFDGRDILSAGVEPAAAHHLVVPLPETWHQSQEVRREDAELIVTAVNALPNLLDRFEERHHGYLEAHPPYVGGDDDEIDEWQAACRGCGFRGQKTPYLSIAYGELVEHLNEALRV